MERVGGTRLCDNHDGAAFRHEDQFHPGEKEGAHLRRQIERPADGHHAALRGGHRPRQLNRLPGAVGGGGPQPKRVGALGKQVRVERAGALRGHADEPPEARGERGKRAAPVLVREDAHHAGDRTVPGEGERVREGAGRLRVVRAVQDDERVPPDDRSC